jgi:hypothetical protein
MAQMQSRIKNWFYEMRTPADNWNMLPIPSALSMITASIELLIRSFTFGPPGIFYWLPIQTDKHS